MTDPKNIKLVVCDVDGTLTDGGMYITSTGEHFKRFNTKDGMAMKILMKHGIEVGMISHSKTTEMVQERAKMLGLKYCYVGQEDKMNVLSAWTSELGISLEEVAYLGDDINDKEVMMASGISACPADAVNSIVSISDVRLTRKGGDACLREFVEDHLKLDL